MMQNGFFWYCAPMVMRSAPLVILAAVMSGDEMQASAWPDGHHGVLVHARAAGQQRHASRSRPACSSPWCRRCTHRRTRRPPPTTAGAWPHPSCPSRPCRRSCPPWSMTSTSCNRRPAGRRLPPMAANPAPATKLRPKNCRRSNGAATRASCGQSQRFVDRRNDGFRDRASKMNRMFPTLVAGSPARSGRTPGGATRAPARCGRHATKAPGSAVGGEVRPPGGRAGPRWPRRSRGRWLLRWTGPGRRRRARAPARLGPAARRPGRPGRRRCRTRLARHHALVGQQAHAGGGQVVAAGHEPVEAGRHPGPGHRRRLPAVEPGHDRAVRVRAPSTRCPARADAITQLAVSGSTPTRTGTARAGSSPDRR